jgi:hypothetical protein
MTLCLPAQVHHCLVGNLAIFLDLSNDRYHAIRTPLGSRLADILAGRVPADDDEPSCQSLRRRGLLVPGGNAACLCSPADIFVPTNSVIETGRERGSLHLGHTIGVTRAFAAATLHLRRRGLAGVVRDLRTRKSSLAARAGSTDAASLALRFHDHRRLVPAVPICLRDSLALLDYLAQFHLSADLVFGVQADPFYAHCWVQTPAAVLNDSGYFPSTLAPLLVI